MERIITWETTPTVPQTITTKTKTTHVTYKQNWPAYNAAQTEEKEQFIVLLNALCEFVDQPPQRTVDPGYLLPIWFLRVYKVYWAFPRGVL